MTNSLLNDFQNCSSELQAWFYTLILIAVGINIAIILYLLFANHKDTYRCGQIDAIRGIIKWKLERNEEGEEVWTKIKNN